MKGKCPMKNPAKSLSAVFPVILRPNGDAVEILLHRRQNTGYMDGMWDIAASGHGDEDEHPKAAAVRECKEEIGISVREEDLTFFHLSHRLSKRNYYDIYFLVKACSGEPTIMEPEKASELKWFALDALPSDMIACRKEALTAYKEGRMYGELEEII
jgi:8-oxo-dGTP pyrophosphatase MutT (NUDIX family)